MLKSWLGISDMAIKILLQKKPSIFMCAEEFRMYCSVPGSEWAYLTLGNLAAGPVYHL